MNKHQEKVMLSLARYLGGQVTPEALEWLHTVVQGLKRGYQTQSPLACRRLSYRLEQASEETKHSRKDHYSVAIGIICNLSYGWSKRTTRRHYPIPEETDYWGPRFPWAGRSLVLRKQMITHVCAQIQDIIDNYDEYAGEYV